MIHGGDDNDTIIIDNGWALGGKGRDSIIVGRHRLLGVNPGTSDSSFVNIHDFYNVGDEVTFENIEGELEIENRGKRINVYDVREFPDDRGIHRRRVATLTKGWTQENTETGRPIGSEDYEERTGRYWEGNRSIGVGYEVGFEIEDNTIRVVTSREERLEWNWDEFRGYEQDPFLFIEL